MDEPSNWLSTGYIKYLARELLMCQKSEWMVPPKVIHDEHFPRSFRVERKQVEELIDINE